MAERSIIPIRAPGQHQAPMDAEVFADHIEARFPVVFKGSPAHSGMRLAEFFAANIRNANTRAAYLQAVAQFLEWAEAKKLSLSDLNPFRVWAYVESLPKRPSLRITRQRESRKGKTYSVTVSRTKFSKPAIKQHLAAVRMLFDWLVVGQVMPMNPAASVRGPKYVIKRGKTPVLSADDARKLLDSIPLTRRIKGLKFRTGDYFEIMNKANCLSLLSNAIIVWNTIQMAEIVEAAERDGKTPPFLSS